MYSGVTVVCLKLHCFIGLRDIVDAGKDGLCVSDEGGTLGILQLCYKIPLGGYSK